MFDDEHRESISLSSSPPLHLGRREVPVWRQEGGESCQCGELQGLSLRDMSGFIRPHRGEVRLLPRNLSLTVAAGLQMLELILLLRVETSYYLELVWSSSEPPSLSPRNSRKICREHTWRHSGERRVSPARVQCELCSSSPSKCGTFYLMVSVVSASGDITEFDSLKLIKKCSDFPGLSLKVVRNSEKVK